MSTTAPDAAVTPTLPVLAPAPIANLRPCGTEGDPYDRLMGTTTIAGVSFHVEANQVVTDDEGVQACVQDEADHNGDLAFDIVGGAAELVELLPGRFYLLHITPFGA